MVVGGVMTRVGLCAMRFGPLIHGPDPPLHLDVPRVECGEHAVHGALVRPALLVQRADCLQSLLVIDGSAHRLVQVQGAV